MGNSSQRSCLSLLPWPLGSTLKLRCSHRRHWVTVTLTLANSRRLDTYGKDSKGHSLASAMKLDRPTLYGFPGPTASILSAPPASVAPPRPSPAPPCLPLQKLLLTQVFPTLQPQTPCPAPPTSAPLFCRLLTS